MLKMTIEHKLTGPLASPLVLRKLEAAVEMSETLEDAAARIRTIPVLETYKGGSHLAVHSVCRSLESGHWSLSPTRLAIITEEPEEKILNCNRCDEPFQANIKQEFFSEFYDGVARQIRGPAVICPHCGMYDHHYLYAKNQRKEVCDGSVQKL